MSQAGSNSGGTGGTAFNFITPVYASTTGNLSASYDNGASGIGATLTNTGALAAFTTDGTTPSLNARILVKDQTTQSENGIYTLTTVGDGATPWVLTRATDYDQPSQIKPGDLVPVQNGTLYGNTIALQTQVVTAVGVSAIAFQEFNVPIITYPLAPSLGGTGVSNPTAHAIAVAEGSSAFNFVAASSTSGAVLQSQGGSADPAWSTASYPSTTTANQLLYSSSANTVAGLTSGNNGVLITSAGGVPSISSTLPSAVQGNITSVGTIASGTWNGSSISPTYGGTGLSNPTAHSLLVAEGASNFVALGAATNGQIPIGSTGADPVLANITSSDASVTISNGAGSINLAVPAGAGLSLAAFGSTPNSNGLSLSAGVLNMQPADNTRPGGVSTTTQTFAGVKTFSSAPNFSSLTASQALVLDGSKNVASLGYDATGTASYLVSRDANGNSVATNWISKATSVSSAGSTTSLTAASSRAQVLTGTLNQTFQLPDATTLVVGWTFQFNNNSSGLLSVVDNGNNAVCSVQAGGCSYVVLTANGTSNGSWDKRFLAPSNVTWGSAGLVQPGYVSSPELLITGSSSGTITIQGQAAAGTYNWNMPTTAGTSGYVLTSAGGGSSAMTWTDPTALGITTVNADSGSATPSAGAITISGGGIGISTSGTGSTISLTGTLAVNHGGTGATTLTGVLTGNGTSAVTASAVTNHGVVIGAASNAVSSTAVGSTGQVLIGSTGADPAFGALGVNSNLTAHGVVIAEGNSAFAATAAGTSGQILQSGGSSADPAWSTATYPSTTTANQLLYSSSTNTVAGLSSANDGVLITSGAGVPSISSTLPSAVQGNITSVGTIASGTWNGTAIDATHGGTNQTTWTTGDLLYASASNTLSKLAIGSSTNVLTVVGGVPSWQPAAGGGGGLTYTVVTAGTTCVAGNCYIDNDTSGTDTFTLPATCAVGDRIGVIRANTGNVTLAANTGQTIRYGSTVTSSAGSLQSQARGDAVTVVCYVANTSWIVDGTTQGNWTSF